MSKIEPMAQAKVSSEQPGSGGSLSKERVKAAAPSAAIRPTNEGAVHKAPEPDAKSRVMEPRRTGKELWTKFKWIYKACKELLRSGAQKPIGAPRSIGGASTVVGEAANGAPKPADLVMDAMLEEVLEKAGKKHIKPSYEKLNGVLKQCLLCFSIFDVQARPAIKKKTMIYWWIGERLVPPEPNKAAEKVAEGIFQELVKEGFIVPVINICTGGIHEFRLHPFVHWMIKAEARDSSFFDLDDRGNPSAEQSKSPRLCLMPTMKTSSNRETASSSGKEASSSALLRQEAASSSDKEASSSAVVESPTLVLFNLNKKYCSLDVDYFSKFSNLVVLQLGRWHSDARDYIEVGGVESLSSIGHLKKLRYFGLLGLSGLTTLPADIKELRNLIILDLRGCQNLERVVVQFTKLRKLTRLDLTECYLLEHITKEIGQLSELQVFKGFVFGGSKRKNRCRLSELSKLKKLRKLSINITSAAKIDHGEMNVLRKFENLCSLTITWGEIPPIVKDERELLEKWTTLKLPEKLQKFDIRCFPMTTMPENWFANKTQLTSLYIRGGKLETLIPEKGGSNDGSIKLSIEILRLKHLKNFAMTWEQVKNWLPNLDRLEVFDCPLSESCPVDGKWVWIRDAALPTPGKRAAETDAATTGKEASPQPASDGAPADLASTVASDLEKVPASSPAPNVTEVTTPTTTCPDATTAISPTTDATKESAPAAKPDPSLAANAVEDTTSALKSDASPPAATPASLPTMDGSKDSTPGPESVLKPAVVTPASSPPSVAEDNMLPPKSDASQLASPPASGPAADDVIRTPETGLSLAAATPATGLALKVDDTAPSTKTPDVAPVSDAA